MNNARLYGIYAITPLHCGTGQASGAIDRPIARESTTDFPLIPAAGIKGALRAFADPAGLATSKADSEPVETESAFNKQRKQKKADFSKSIVRIFGKTESSGALTITDARLLLLPVRSLQATFFWTTCPLILQRLSRDARIANPGADAEKIPEIPSVGEGQAICSDASRKGSLVLEDLALRLDPQASTALKDWANYFQNFLPLEDRVFRPRIESHLVLLSDVDFQDLVRRVPPVNARIRIDPVTGTTSSGALWYEETLAPDSLLYTIASLDLKNGAGTDSLNDWSLIDKAGVLQLGGNESVGQGFTYWHHREKI